MFVLIAFSYPCAVKAQNGIVAPLKVELHTHELFDSDILFALVEKSDASCDDIAILKNGVEKVELCTENFVFKNNGQSFAFAVALGKSVKLGFYLGNGSTLENEVRCEVVVSRKQLH